jgi:hypothetical protein
MLRNGQRKNSKTNSFKDGLIRVESLLVEEFAPESLV